MNPKLTTCLLLLSTLLSWLPQDAAASIPRTSYGGLQGLGGLEAIIGSDGITRGIVNDWFGNTVGHVTAPGAAITWSSAQFLAWGPAPGWSTPPLDGTKPLHELLGYRGLAVDPPGYVQQGLRPYDPQAGRWLAPDPVGHAGSLSLYDYCDNDPLNVFDPDGRFGKGVSSGWSGSISSSAPNTGSFNAGMMFGGSIAGGAEGFRGGSSITANTFTFGGSDALGWTHSSQYQGSAYTGSRILSTIGRETAITAATFGTAQLARGGSQAALYAYQGLQVSNAARSGYNIGQGSYRASQGDNWGYVQAVGGALGATGSITYAASNPSLNAIAGIGSKTGGFAQGFVNWWNKGSAGDSAFRDLTPWQQLKSEIGMKSLPNDKFASVSHLDPVARGSQLLKENPFGAVFGNNYGQIWNLLGTGPSPAVRLYIPPGGLVGSGGANGANAIAVPQDRSGL